jgi:uncharacterized Ntn-hydrolase superfamily protein
MRYAVFCAAAVAVALSALPARAAVAPKTIATFSVVAYDPATGETGVAVQSRFFAVGTVVPWARAGVGAVASQAFGQPMYGPRGLDLMAQGYTPDEALQVLLLNDDMAEQRQLGVVRAVGKGDAATYTGSQCMDWAGGTTGVAPDGVVYSVQGNILTGADVVQAMAAAMDNPAALDASKLTAAERQAIAVPGLAGRMLTALLAGEALGGDSRGMESSALKVAQAGAGYGGYDDVKYDLRVDDAPDPFNELARLLNLAYPIALTNEAYNVLNSGDPSQAEPLFRRLLALKPDDANSHYNLACALSREGKAEEGLAELKTALELDPKLRQSAQADTDLVNVRALPAAAALLGSGGPGTPAAAGAH